MGTNYYLYAKPTCPTCGRPFEEKHIGKSSTGWCFSLHVEPDVGIRDLDDWEQLWSQPGAEIYNEYGSRIPVEAMQLMIMARTRPERWDEALWGYPSWDAFHRDNHSEQGPFGLLRHRIEANHCIGHGAGTWDLIVGEFS